MDAVIVLLTLLVLASLGAAVLGLIKPSLVRVGSRGKAFGIYCGLAFVLMMVIGVIAPKQDKNNMEVGLAKKEEGIQVVVDEKAAKQPLSQAVEYKVIHTRDTSVSRRTRLNFHIVTDKNNLTYEQKAETVIKAAKELQKKHNARLVTVALEMCPETECMGYTLARSEYAPDNGGYSGEQGWTWKVTSSKDNPSVTGMTILKAWYKHRDRFQKNGMTDEPALSSYLAAELGLPVDQITLPVAWLEPYPYP